MKIAHVIWSLTTGGIETMLVNIINEQIKTEEVELFIVNELFFDPLLRRLSPRCKVNCSLRRTGSRNPLPIIRLNIRLWRFSPDIVHVHAGGLSDIIIDRRRMVRTIHSTNENCREFSRMKALYAISEAVREDLLKRQYDSIVVENGVPTSLIRQKKDYQLKKKFYQLVQVSRLYIKHKGQDILLQALKELIQNRGINNFQLHLIGDGESRRFLEKMVKDLSLEIFVVFEGAKTQEYIFEHLADYDCFVQPSRQEGFGLTVAEAMAAKLPVLVSNLDGPMEIVDNGRVGMLFERDNPIDLADKLEVILRGDYDYRMIEKAYERVVTMYDVSMTANKYIQEYRKIVG